MKKYVFIFFVILGIIPLYLLSNFLLKNNDKSKNAQLINENADININQVYEENNNLIKSSIEQDILEKPNNFFEESLHINKENPSPKKTSNNHFSLLTSNITSTPNLSLEPQKKENDFYLVNEIIIENEPVIDGKILTKNLVDENQSLTKPLEISLTKDVSESNSEKNLIFPNFPLNAYCLKFVSSINDFFDYYRLKPFYVSKILKENENIKITKNKKSRPAYKTKQTASSRRISKIIVLNNKYTKTSFLKKRIKAKPGDCLNEKKLQQHLNFINLNPFRNVGMIIDDKENIIELICHDRFYFRPYIGLDNTGLKIIKQNRLYAGIDWNNPFGLDSILSYQYLASFDFDKFQSHTGKWTFFLPWENFLSLTASYAQINADHMIPYIIKHRGSALQALFRYNICLPMINLLTHNLILGFDFKRTDTNLIFSRFMASDDIFVNLTQFLISYDLNWKNSFYTTKMLLEVYFSLGPMVCDEENYRYNGLRTYAQNQYVYAKGYLSNLFKIPKDFLISLFITGQITNENLLPSETLSLAGYNAVRGYYERQINTDSGVILNFEVRSPSISFISKKNITDSLRFIAFVDYGYGSIHTPFLFTDKNYDLLGYGPGLRYNIDPYLAIRLDWGIKGIKKDEYGEEKSLFHFSFNLSY